MRIFFILLILAPLCTQGQYRLMGVVTDSISGQVLPGANVVMRGAEGIITDAKGRFDLNSETPTATVAISFIGLKTKILVLDTGTVARILMVEEKSREGNRFLKTSLSLGYFGDVRQAPIGALSTWELQSIGKMRVELQTSFKYWKQSPNHGLELSVSKQMPHTKITPEYLQVEYKSWDYASRSYTLQQVRGVFTKMLRHDIGLDAGVSSNRIRTGPESMATFTHRTGAILGLTTVFYPLGLFAQMNYLPSGSHYEAGFFIKAFSMVLTGKYYTYQQIQGVQLSLRVRLFSSRFYCCHFDGMYNEYFSALR